MGAPEGSQLCTGETRRTMFSRLVKLIGEWIAIYKGYSTHSTCSERSLLLLLEHFILLHLNFLSPIPASHVSLLFPLGLSLTFFLQSATAPWIFSHHVTVDKNWSLCFVQFLVCFLLWLFSLIFSNVKHFFLWIRSRIEGRSQDFSRGTHNNPR